MSRKGQFSRTNPAYVGPADSVPFQTPVFNPGNELFSSKKGGRKVNTQQMKSWKESGLVPEDKMKLIDSEEAAFAEDDEAISYEMFEPAQAKNWSESNEEQSETNDFQSNLEDGIVLTKIQVTDHLQTTLDGTFSESETMQETEVTPGRSNDVPSALTDLHGVKRGQFNTLQLDNPDESYARNKDIMLAMDREQKKKRRHQAKSSKGTIMPAEEPLRQLFIDFAKLTEEEKQRFYKKQQVWKKRQKKKQALLLEKALLDSRVGALPTPPPPSSSNFTDFADLEDMTSSESESDDDDNIYEPGAVAMVNEEDSDDSYEQKYITLPESQTESTPKRKEIAPKDDETQTDDHVQKPKIGTFSTQPLAPSVKAKPNQNQEASLSAEVEEPQRQLSVDAKNPPKDEKQLKQQATKPSQEFAVKTKQGKKVVQSDRKADVVPTGTKTVKQATQVKGKASVSEQTVTGTLTGPSQPAAQSLPLPLVSPSKPETKTTSKRDEASAVQQPDSDEFWSAFRDIMIALDHERKNEAKQPQTQPTSSNVKPAVTSRQLSQLFKDIMELSEEEKRRLYLKQQAKKSQESVKTSDLTDKQDENKHPIKQKDSSIKVSLAGSSVSRSGTTKSDQHALKPPADTMNQNQTIISPETPAVPLSNPPPSTQPSHGPSLAAVHSSTPDSAPPVNTVSNVSNGATDSSVMVGSGVSHTTGMKHQKKKMPVRQNESGSCLLCCFTQPLGIVPKMVPYNEQTDQGDKKEQLQEPTVSVRVEVSQSLGTSQGYTQKVPVVKNMEHLINKATKVSSAGISVSSGTTKSDQHAFKPPADTMNQNQTIILPETPAVPLSNPPPSIQPFHGSSSTAVVQSYTPDSAPPVNTVSNVSNGATDPSVMVGSGVSHATGMKQQKKQKTEQQSESGSCLLCCFTQPLGIVPKMVPYSEETDQEEQLQQPTVNVRAEAPPSQDYTQKVSVATAPPLPNTQADYSQDGVYEPLTTTKIDEVEFHDTSEQKNKEKVSGPLPPKEESLPPTQPVPYSSNDSEKSKEDTSIHQMFDKKTVQAYKKVFENLPHQTDLLTDKSYRCCTGCYCMSSFNCSCGGDVSGGRITNITTDALQKGSSIGWKMFADLVTPLLNPVFRIVIVSLEFGLGLFAFIFSSVSFSLGSNAGYNGFYLFLSILSLLLATLDFVLLVKYDIRWCVILVWQKYKRARDGNLDSATEEQQNNTDAEKLLQAKNSEVAYFLPTILQRFWDISRILLAEFLFFPLLICDLVDLIVGKSYQFGSTSDGLNFCLFLYSMASLVFYVYVVRLGALAVQIYHLNKLRTITPSQREQARKENANKKASESDAALMFTDDKESDKVNSEIASRGMKFHLYFFFHVAGQMAMQIMMIVAISIKIAQDNHDKTPDDTLHASNALWFMMFSGWVLPYAGIMSFFIATYYWVYEFPNGIAINMLSILECQGIDSLFPDRVKEALKELRTKSEDTTKNFGKSEAHVKNLNKTALKNDYKELAGRPFPFKFAYPFTNPFLVIACFLYVTVLIAFVIVTVTSIQFENVGFLFYYAIAGFIGVAANAYVLAVVRFWVDVLLTIVYMILGAGCVCCLCLAGFMSSNRKKKHR